MNEQAFARRLAMHLSAAAREIDGELAGRLRAAREQALRTRPASRGLARLLGLKTAFRFTFPAVVRPAALAVAILASVLAGDYWLTWSRVTALQEVDTALLIDDLPIDAYLDADFKAWLQQDTRS